MSDTARTIHITLSTGSLGPRRDTTLSIALPDGADLPPLVIEDPSPQYPGAWRRVSGRANEPSYVRIARIAAP